MLLTPLVPVLIALGSGGYIFWNHSQQTLLDRLSLVSAKYAYIVDQYLDDCMGDLAMVGSELSPGTDSLALKRQLETLQAKRKEFVDIGVLDAEGTVRAYAGPALLKGSHISGGRWMQESLERGMSVSGVQSGQMGIPHVILARRVLLGETPFVLRVSLDPEVLNRMISELREDGSDIFLINRKGEIIAGSGGQVLTLERELAEPGFLDRLGSTFYDQRSEAAYSSRIMRHTGWVLTVRKSMKSFSSVSDASLLFVAVFIISGGIIVFLSSLYLTGYVQTVLRQRDEEREKLREQLYRAGRLAELGEMAAGFAHEINNPLQIIKSDQAYIEMLLQDFKENCGASESCANDIEEIAGSIAQIRVQIDRCARITHSILGFGRAGAVEEQNIDLAKFIPDVLTMIQKKIQLSNIVLKVNINPAKLVVHVDPGRLQQVLLNLLNNAIYAVQEPADGRVGELEIGCMPAGEDRVRIEIIDNGMGISPENQKLIFTPFFTTKPAGSGTGLGLSVCHGIVDSMNGVMDFTSVKGFGSTFFILLPRVAIT